MGWTRLGLAGASAFVVLTLAVPAAAQRLGAQRFVPAGSEDGVLGTEGADRREQFRPYVSLWYDVADDPVVVVDGDGERVGDVVGVANALNLVATMNLVAGLEVGVGAPLTLYANHGGAEGQVGLTDFPRAAFGDLQLRLGYRIPLTWRTSIALHVPIRFPTSPDDDLFSTGFAVKPTFALLHGFDHVDLLVNLAYMYREESNVVDYAGGQELEARLAARIGLDEHWDTSIVTELAVATTTSDFFSAAGTPAEGRLGIERWLNPDWRIGAFAGTGLSRGVGAPDWRVGLHLAFGVQPPRPRPHWTGEDQDGDGIPDDEDQCPTEREDEDGFEDEDGCPDIDNDEDGYLDVDDPCPDQPETEGGLSDDGCPDRVALEEGGLVLLEPIRFEVDSDEIREESEPVVTEIAEVLRRHPDLRVRIEGHTDAIGRPDHNLDLSERRAQTVRAHLVDEGIDEGRLEAHGYGETRPLDSNQTRGGRHRNRRVEFKIIGAGDGAVEEVQ